MSFILSDAILEIWSDNLIRAHHPNNTIHDIIVYFKKISPFVNIRFSFYFLNRSPNQFLEEFETIVDNIDLNLNAVVKSNPFLIVLFGDLNAKLSL